MKWRTDCLNTARIALLASLFLSRALGEEGAGGESVDFGREVRPILAEKCFPCHGPDEKKRKGDVRLDTEEGLFSEVDDGFAVVRGDSEKSVVYQRLIHKSKRRRMPPAKWKKTVSKEEIELIRRWIDEGATWKRHWSLVAPRETPVPAVRRASWPRNEIDAFVLRRLEKEGLSPSPEADKTTLIRRVTLDLTGLPPTPEEVDAFLADESPDAYERVVDRLLGSATYGEHMARYWLDAARYGDTHGLHLDNLRQIWPYRDWVIEAFNTNMPFDEFTIEQLAGDLLPEATIEQRVATGFNRCNVTTSEGGVIPEEYHVHYTVDRVATMSTVWMGISMGCVRCHEHKFDPFEMKDFYQLYAFFNSLNGPVMDGNKPLPPPVLKAPRRANRKRITQLEPQIEALRQQVEARGEAATEDFIAWVASESARDHQRPVAPRAGLVGHWPFDSASGGDVPNHAEGGSPGKLKGAKLTAGKLGRASEVADGKFVDLGDTASFERTETFSYGAWVNVKPGNTGGAVIARMDDAGAHRGYDLYIAGDRVIAHFIHHWPSNALKVETKNRIKPDGWHHLFVTYDGSGKSGGVRIYIDGASSPLKVVNDNLTGTIVTRVSLKVGRRTPGATLNGLVDDVRIYKRALTPSEVRTLAEGDEIRNILATGVEERTPEDEKRLRTYYLENHDPPYRQLSAKLATLEKRKRELETEGAIATLTWEDAAEPKPAHILIRGQYDKPGERVERDTPAALPPLPAKMDGRTPTRLDLARWLVSPEHPLTARVTVNRFWQQYFGVGIVETTEDFGSQGALPSHPELLDWLAIEFRTSGWDVKRLQKLIVMSSTYRQSSAVTPELLARDRANRLLARGPRFRLDAEVIRDSALAVSGLLVPRIGGPSVKPYQPPGIWKAVGYTDSNTANYSRDSGEALYRRSMYTFWKRTAPPPSMVAFDAPSRETCTVRRSRTNTPLAALTLMNGEQLVEASRHLAQRVMVEGGATHEDRAAYAFRLVTSRRPGTDELELVVSVFNTHLGRYERDREAARGLIHVGDTEPPPQLDESHLAAWTMVANLLLNLDEFITKG